MAEQAVLTFSNVPLLFDCGRVAQQFLDRYLPVEQMIAPPENPARDDWHTNTIGQGRAGLPRPNYPPPPRPQVNTLYWPTGAARWARGWFLCDQAGHDALTSSGDAESAWKDGTATAQTLAISTPGPEGSTAYALDAKMYLLRPLRITATADETFGDLWLLPLVDQRYWWQFRRCGDLSGALDSWADLVTALGLQLGRKIDCQDVNTAYLRPDPIELCRSEENLAVVLDAVAYSIGRRVVVQYDETVKLARYTDEQTVLTTNRANVAAQGHLGLQAGTPDTEAPPPAYPWPDELRIAFEKVEDPGNTGAKEFWTSAVTADTAAASTGALDLVTVEGTTRTVHCSAWAMFQCSGSTTDPANKTNLDALASQYATDYFGWLLHQYDHSWPGVQDWDPTGYDDHVLFELGTEYLEDLQAIADLDDQQLQTNDILIQERLARRYLTRVQSMPANHGVNALLCQYEHAIPGSADGLMVLTPAGGIKARDCLNVYSACCCVYHTVPNGTGTATMEPVYCSDSIVPWKIRVYNIANVAVSGDDFVLTDLLKNGLRIVTVESCSDDNCATCAASS